MNTNPIHFDDHYAATTQHGKCLVNGILVFAITVGMSVRDVSQNALANLEYESVKHLGPTFHGDTIYAETEVVDKRESKSRPQWGIVTFEHRARNQHGDLVMRARRNAMLRKRSS